MSEIPMFPDECIHQTAPEGCWRCLSARAIKAEGRVAELEAGLVSARSELETIYITRTQMVEDESAWTTVIAALTLANALLGSRTVEDAPSMQRTNEARHSREDLLNAMGRIIEICAPDLDGAYHHERQIWEVEQLARGALSPRHQFVPYPGPRSETPVRANRVCSNCGDAGHWYSECARVKVETRLVVTNLCDMRSYFKGREDLDRTGRLVGILESAINLIEGEDCFAATRTGGKDT